LSARVILTSIHQGRRGVNSPRVKSFPLSALA
jgi:hypothetical protein